MEQKQISLNVIARLPKYYRYLQECHESGANKVSSSNISSALGITASQVRQDLSNFGGFGQQGYGYDVQFLLEKLRNILGLNETHKAIIVGGGRIGQALSSYSGFIKENVIIKAVFDVELSHVSAPKDIEILHVAEMPEYVKRENIDIAIISTQKEFALSVAETLKNAGIKAIWNFAPIDINLGDDVAVENINMSESLFRLSYKMKKK